MAIDDVADDGFEDGVSEKLESLIVERLVAEFFDRYSCDLWANAVR